MAKEETEKAMSQAIYNVHGSLYTKVDEKEGDREISNELGQEKRRVRT